MSSPVPDPIPEVEEAFAREDVRALQALAADKRTGKAAKRALHRLRVRGIAIPEFEAAPAARPPAGAGVVGSQQPREPFFATAIDGDGTRAIFMPIKAPLGFELHLPILSEESGILKLDSQQFSRRQLRAFMAEQSAWVRAFGREITDAKAAALLTAAIDLNPGSPFAAKARELLRGLPPANLPAPSAAEAETSADDDLALRESAQLLDSAALSGYLPPSEVVESMGQKLEEVMVSPLLIDEAQRLTQMRHVLERAAAEYFTPRRRTLYGARLLDLAELFASRGDDANAARARAAGKALSSGRPLDEIPFAGRMFERIFDLEAIAKMTPSASEDVAPTPGGLILPP